ncbi:MAG: VIT domain-containing protein [Bacteroidota bacterium]
MLFCLFALSLSAQTTLAITNPQWWWGSYEPGQIEAASIHLSPQGTYAKVELEMEIGQAYNTWALEDTLEIILHFELPQDAIVTDSYLWINDERVQADIFERDFGTQTYESFVDRNQDPSLLLKMNQGKFQLRVFPLAGTETRRVRMDFLIPMTWHEAVAAATLPTQLLKTSHQQDFPVTLSLENSTAFPLVGYSNPALSWTQTDDLWTITTSAENLLTGDYVQWSLPATDGVWLEVDPTINKYQYLVDTEHFVPNTTGKDVAVVLHFDHATEASPEAIAQTLERGLRQFLHTGDRLTIIRDGTSTPTWLTDWNDLRADLTGGGTEQQLATKLRDANLFLNENASQERLVISVTAQEFGTFSVDELINEFPDPTLLNPTYHWDVTFQEPTTLYNTERAVQTSVNTWILHTGGFITRNGSFEERLFRALDNASVANGILELDLDPVGGLTYDSYGTNTDFGLRPRYTSYGQYIGADDWELEVVSFVNNELVSIAQPLVPAPANSDFLHEIHVGQQLKARELAQANSISIANESIAERVLSLYTVFLALDPAVVSQPDDDCVGCGWEQDDTPIVFSTTEVPGRPWEVEVLGNPVQDRLQLQWRTVPDVSSVQVLVYDSRGQRVKQQQLNGPFTDGTTLLNVTWPSQWPAGLYWLQIRADDEVQTIKLVVQ